ncbi:MAG: OsmC family protein [Clostridia bacterium]|nr:OsmC family protein [Clostridia bacterium]
MAKEVFKAKVSWDKKSVACTAEARGMHVKIDEPESLGGTDTGMNPVELLLSALGGCVTISLLVFAPKFDVNIQDCYVTLEGDLDPDGFLGKNPAVRKGFSHIRFTIHLKTDSPRENVQKLYDHFEKNCPVADTLQGVPISGVYQLNS